MPTDRAAPAPSDRVVVAGAQTAGLTTAETLRADGFSGEIVLIGAEQHLPYNRPALSKQLLRGSWTAADCRVVDPSRIAGLGLDLRLGTRAHGVDTDRRVLDTDRGPIGYGTLVIATGASAVRPRRPGFDTPAVLTLRSLDDAAQITGRLGAGVRVAVIGTGLLGSEVAAAAAHRGADVVLIGRSAGIRFGAAGTAFSSRIAGLHEANGVRVRLGASVTAVERGRAETTVRLASGAAVPTDLVIVAAGARPAVEWLAGSGLLTDGRLLAGSDGLVAERVFVAGDAGAWWDPAAGRHIEHGHQLTAIEQGRAVARRILGQCPVAPVPYFWCELYGDRVQAYGHLDGATDRVVLDGEPNGRRVVWGFARRGRLTGIVGWNAARPFRELRSRIGEPLPSRRPEPGATAPGRSRQDLEPTKGIR